MSTLRDDLSFAVVPLGREKGEAILARWDAMAGTRDDLELVEAYIRHNSREAVIWTTVKPAPVTRAEALRALGRLRREA